MNSPDSGIPCDSFRWETALELRRWGAFEPVLLISAGLVPVA